MSEDIKDYGVDEELYSQLEVGEKGTIKVPTKHIRSAMKRAGLDYDEVNNLQKNVNQFVGTVANTCGRKAVDAFAENDEIQQVVSTFSVGQTTPILTTKRSKDVPVAVNDKTKGTRAVAGHSRLDMRKSMPDNMRKSIQASVQSYAETRMGDGKK